MKRVCDMEQCSTKKLKVDVMDVNAMIPVESIPYFRKVCGKDKYVSALFYHVCMNNEGICMEMLSDDVVDVEKGSDVESMSPLYAAVELGRLSLVKLLLRKGANVKFMLNGETSLIYIACKQGHLQILKELVSAVNERSFISISKKNGMTPLHVAAQNGNISVCEYLLENKFVSVSAVSDSGSSALHLATYQKRESVIECLLRFGACVDLPDDQGWTPIHVASQNGNREILKLLVDGRLLPNSSLIVEMRAIVRELIGAEHVPTNDEDINETSANHVTAIRDPFFTTLAGIDWFTANLATLPMEVVRILRMNRRKEDGYLPLMVSCRSGVESSVTECLLEFGANPHSQLPEGITPLMIASKNGRLQHVDVLTSRLEKKDILVGTLNHAWTALHWAVKGGCVQVVRHLMNLPNVFEVDLPVLNGMTALYIASHHGHISVVKCLHEEYNADPNWSIDSGATPLYTACKNGRLEVVKYLIKEGNVSINSSNLRGSTLLHTAAKFNHLDIVKYLEDDLNMDVTVRNDQGWTPIHSAARIGALEVMKHFVEKYGKTLVATITTTAGNRTIQSPNFTPLHLAASNGCMDLVRYLVDPRHVGARLDVTCGDGSTAETLADREGHQLVGEWLKRAAHWSKIHFIVDAREPDALMNLLTSDDKLDCEETRYLWNQTNGDYNDTPLSISLMGPVDNTHQNRFANVEEIVLPKSVNIQPYLDKFKKLIIEPERPIACLKVCDRTASMVIMTMLPWSPANHYLYPKSFKKEVLTFLLINQRLEFPDSVVQTIFQYLPRYII